MRACTRNSRPHGNGNLLSGDWSNAPGVRHGTLEVLRRECMDTFAEWLANPKSPRWHTRSLWDWWGSITLSEREGLELSLILFHSADSERATGTTYVFKWDSQQSDLVFHQTEKTGKPVLDGHSIKVPIPWTNILWFNQNAVAKLSANFVELFLDDQYRVKLISSLNGEQRMDVLRWFSDNGLAIYRKLHDPNFHEFRFVKAVFPPKLDFE